MSRRLHLCASIAFIVGWSGTLTAGNMYDQEMKMDNGGNVVAVWVDKATIPAIKAATRPDGGVWSSAVAISTTIPSMQPTLAINSTTGDAVAVWAAEDATNGVTCLLSSMLPFNGSWTTPVAISTATSNCLSNVDLSISSTGAIVALWPALLSGETEYVMRSASASMGGSWTSAVTVDETATNPPKSSKRSRRRRR